LMLPKSFKIFFCHHPAMIPYFKRSAPIFLLHLF
jgi:hypothetical protein